MLLTLLLAIQRTSEYLVKEEVFFNNQCTKNQKARCTIIRESRLVTKRNEAQTSREEPKEGQDENFVSTAAPRPQPLHRRCTGAGFGKAARKP